jgi:hypothetical protein
MASDLFNKLTKTEPEKKKIGRIIFAMDATSSRNHAWNTVSKIHKDMFTSIERIGDLEVKLMFFRGETECKASPWLNNPRALHSLLDQVSCEAGRTQIGRILTHASAEHDKSTVHAVIYIGGQPPF